MQSHDKQLEEGIYIGNQVDKANLNNPIARKLVAGFDSRLFQALDVIQPNSLHEVGCGEGRLTRMIRDRYQIEVLASDFSESLVEENLRGDHRAIDFKHLSIYDLNPESHRRQTVVCCEVLEHLESPGRGLKSLRRLNADHYVFSVPREPIWRILNVARFQYLRDWGNTPGHLNHWSPRSFYRDLENNGFKIEQVLNPFPWIMVRLKPD